MRRSRVSRSGYYQWQKPELGPRAEANRALGEQIREVFAAHKGRYGSPRVTRALRVAGVRCGENRVARLMRERGLAARPKWAFRPRTTRAGVTAAAPNLIKGLAPSRPDQIFHSDQGCQYSSEAVRKPLTLLGAQPSMSARGNCYDNATHRSVLQHAENRGLP